MRLPTDPLASPFHTTNGSVPDPFDLGLVALPGTRPTEEAAHVAQELALRMGEHSPVIDVYLRSLSKVPANHLRFLQLRGTRVVFAPTIAAALESKWAAARRGRPLTAAEALDGRTRYSREAQVAALYEPGLDLVILPTTWTSKAVDRVVLHEVGHALTFHQAEVRVGLLVGLPPGLAQHVLNPTYGAEGDAHTLRRRCLEALAEAYVYLVTGRVEELPGSLLSELMFILTAVADADDSIRLDFPEGDQPTALRVPGSSIIGPEDPHLGWIFSSEVSPNEALETHELADDELARHRRRRHAA